jgi:hypothetical protein
LEDERRWERDPVEDWTWAHWLQESLKETHILHNYGTITNDNKTIVRSIIYKVSELLKEGVSPENISVIAQWTTLTRNSFFVTPEKYNETNSVKDIVSISRGIGHCKVIDSQLNPHYVDFNAFYNYRQLYCFIIFFYQISQTNCTYLNIFTIN